MTANPEKNKISFKDIISESGANSVTLGQESTDFFPPMIYVCDAVTNKLQYANSNLTSILGYSYEDLIAEDSDLLKLIFSDDKVLVKTELETLSNLNNNDNRSYQCRMNHKAGDWRNFHTTGTVFRRNEAGKPVSFLFIAQDISDHAKEAVRWEAMKKLFNESEDLLRFGTWSWDIIKNEFEWSEGLKKLFETQKDIQDKSLTMEFFIDHASAKEKDVLMQLIDEAVRKRTGFEYSYTLNTETGHQKVVSTKARPLVNENGELLQFIGVTRDITEQILINRDLTDYKQMMMDKEKFLGSGSWTFDFETKKFTWSEGKYRLFGYDPSGQAPLPEPNESLYLRHIPASQVQKLREIWDEVLIKEQNHSWEYEIITVDGTHKDIETYARIIRDDAGTALRVIGASRDVTRMREYEESLKKKITELDRSNKELEEFAYIASHDLQEPLRKITSFSERLRERSDTGGTFGREERFYIERMMVATENMRMLIDNLLEFSRTSRHNMPFEKVNLDMILSEVKADLELKIEETGATISSERLPVIEGIPMQVRQLFSNLITNAIKFRKPGNIPDIRIENGEILSSEMAHHAGFQKDKYVSVRFIDKGIGFDPEYSSKIFQIFQRLHGKSEYPGSGIGLAICKKIAENHNGMIYAEGIPQEGSVFTVILPRNQH